MNHGQPYFADKGSTGDCQKEYSDAMDKGGGDTNKDGWETCCDRNHQWGRVRAFPKSRQLPRK